MKKYICLLLAWSAIYNCGCSQMEQISAKALEYTQKFVDSVPLVRKVPPPGVAERQRQLEFEREFKRRKNAQIAREIQIITLTNYQKRDFSSAKNQPDRNAIYYADILRTRLLNELNFHKNFCHDGPNTRYMQLAMAEKCRIVTANFPGSQVNCFHCSGTWLSGPFRSVFGAGGTLMDERFSAGPVEVSVKYKPANPAQLPEFTLIKHTEGANYITMRFEGNPFRDGDLFHPAEAQADFGYTIIDAHLPDVARSAVTIMSNPTVEVQKNALVRLLNNGYSHFPTLTLDEYSYNLLSDLKFRQNFLRKAKNYVD